MTRAQQALITSKRIKDNEITKDEFATKIATAMKEISSSHVYFIIQEAFGEIDWEEANKLLEKMMIKK